MKQALTIYFAGDLFDHKDLVGNALLAAAIDSRSEGSYKCILPQNLELPSNRAEVIRNNDLKQVLECDLALFNFDGTELDSGTVVEYMYAKMLDKPSVIIRTDFRASGDQEKGDPWNLMCSFYPRTSVLKLNAMAEYHTAMAAVGKLKENIDTMYITMADKIIAAFDEVRQEQSVFEQAGVDPDIINTWAKHFPGQGFQNFVGE